MKQCRSCAEPIKDAAAKCRYCGEWQTPQPTKGEKPKDPWDKFDVAGRVLGLLLIPGVLALLGSTGNQSLKRSDVNLRMVELAIEVLRVEPTTNNAALKDWAIKVIDQHSDVKFSEPAQAELKSEPLPRSGGVVSGVPVTVRTVNSAGLEVGGYVVWYVPRGLLTMPSAHERFPRPSSPTTAELAPGNYVFWCQRQDTKTEQVAVQVGGHGAKALAIDLRVP
jgi:hypothetical protein